MLKHNKDTHVILYFRCRGGISTLHSRCGKSDQSDAMRSRVEAKRSGLSRNFSKIFLATPRHSWTSSIRVEYEEFYCIPLQRGTWWTFLLMSKGKLSPNNSTEGLSVSIQLMDLIYNLIPQVIWSRG